MRPENEKFFEKIFNNNRFGIAIAANCEKSVKKFGKKESTFRVLSRRYKNGLKNWICGFTEKDILKGGDTNGHLRLS